MKFLITAIMIAISISSANADYEDDFDGYGRQNGGDYMRQEEENYRRSQRENQESNDYYRQQQKQREYNMQQQQLNHGAGGCTPNFSTGGCL